MLIRFVEHIGTKTIGFFTSLFNALSFTLICFFSPLSFKDYNSQTLDAFIKNIYSISIASLEKFIFTAVVFGSLIIGVVIVLAAQYNMQMQIGSIIVTFVLNEFAALFTAFFVYFKLIPLINSEQRVFKVDLFIPQLLSAILSAFMLSILFAIIMLSSGLIVTSFVMSMDFHTYKNIIFNAIEIHNIVILTTKSLLFGFVSVVVLNYNALNGTKTPLMVLIINMFFIEILSLALQFLLS